MNTNNLKRIILALGILALAGFAAAQSADPKPFLGAWKGTLSIAGAELEIGLNFKLDDAKKIEGTFDSITQGAFGLALSDIEIKGKTLTCALAGVPGDPTLKATLDETGKKMTGEFTQSGYTGTFSVDKQ